MKRYSDTRWAKYWPVVLAICEYLGGLIHTKGSGT